MKLRSSEILTPEELKSYRIVEDWCYMTPDNIEPFFDEILKDCRFDKIIFEKVVFFRGIFEKGIHFKDCFFDGGIFFDGGGFKSDVWFSECYVSEYLMFKDGVSFEKYLYINRLSAEYVNFQDAKLNYVTFNFKVIKDFYLMKVSFADMRISSHGDSRLEKLDVNGQGTSGILKIYGGDDGLIVDLFIKGGSKDLNLTVESIVVLRFYVFIYTSGLGLRLSKIKPAYSNLPAEFLMAGSNLGKAEWYDIDLSQFQLVNICDSYLTETIFVGITWPKYFHYYEYGVLNSDKSIYRQRYERYISGYHAFMDGREMVSPMTIRINYRDKRSLEKLKDTFRQIKSSYARQGDPHLEHYFHALEMKQMFQLQTWRKDGIQKMIVGFSYYLSDFGQSFIRPLIGLMAGHMVLFFLLVIFGNLPLRVSPSFQPSDVNLTLYYFLRLINPIRTFDFAGRGLSITIDICMRIWSSYMLFNLVKASRRFIK